MCSAVKLIHRVHSSPHALRDVNSFGEVTFVQSQFVGQVARQASFSMRSVQSLQFTGPAWV